MRWENTAPSAENYSKASYKTPKHYVFLRICCLLEGMVVPVWMWTTCLQHLVYLLVRSIYKVPQMVVIVLVSYSKSNWLIVFDFSILVNLGLPKQPVLRELIYIYTKGKR